MSTSTQLGRTYNETHVPRRHTPGNRRFSIYISWSYPGEANRDVTELDNRFSTMVEVRRVGWPAFEAARFADPLLFQRGIAGSLELFFLAWVPCQQRFGRYTRALMRGLGVPVENRWGLRPASVPGTNRIAPFSAMRDLDTRGWLAGVTNFNFHMHLPHYALTTDDRKSVHVLARQPIDLSRPHPFTEEGHREFNMFLWMPPDGNRAGDILMADSTIFSTLFGADESLERFWKNLATS